MAYHFQVPAEAEYRNFNLCPHCEWWGEEPTLSRMSEGMPMISRSDGKNFHLLLADRPLPYPAERGTGPTEKLSVCFWYSHVNNRAMTESAVALLERRAGQRGNLFRQVEFIADLLAAELARGHSLAQLYELRGDALREIKY